MEFHFIPTSTSVYTKVSEVVSMVYFLYLTIQVGTLRVAPPTFTSDSSSHSSVSALIIGTEVVAVDTTDGLALTAGEWLLNCWFN